MISRPLWATYVVTPEQKSSGILISELFKVRKWVVEKFHGISPGLVIIEVCKMQLPLQKLIENHQETQKIIELLHLM